MNRKIAVLTGVLVMGTWMTAPADGGQASPDKHATHHPNAQTGQAKPAAPAEAATLDALVKAMNAARGEAKVDAIAAVVTALVQQHQGMHGVMGRMPKMQEKHAGAAAK